MKTQAETLEQPQFHSHRTRVTKNVLPACYSERIDFSVLDKYPHHPTDCRYNPRKKFEVKGARR